MAELKDMKIDSVTGDLVIENGDIAFVEDGEALLQRIRIKFKTSLGEYFLNRAVGLPYLQKDDEGRQILGKQTDPVDIGDIFQEKILATNGIKELKLFRFDLDTKSRIASINFEAESIFGTVVFSEDIP